MNPTSSSKVSHKESRPILLEALLLYWFFKIGTVHIHSRGLIDIVGDAAPTANGFKICMKVEILAVFL